MILVTGATRQLRISIIDFLFKKTHINEITLLARDEQKARTYLQKV